MKGFVFALFTEEKEMQKGKMVVWWGLTNSWERQRRKKRYTHLNSEFQRIARRDKKVFLSAQCKEIQPVHSEGDQPWVFIGRNDAKAETPVLWPPHEKSWLIGKDSDAGKDWRQEEKGTTEDEMAGWHHQLNGRESEWTLGVGDGQGGLACCDSWGHKESDTTERLNWTELRAIF